MKVKIKSNIKSLWMLSLRNANTLVKNLSINLIKWQTINLIKLKIKWNVVAVINNQLAGRSMKSKHQIWNYLGAWLHRLLRRNWHIAALAIWICRQIKLWIKFIKNWGLISSSLSTLVTLVKLSTRQRNGLKIKGSSSRIRENTTISTVRLSAVGWKSRCLITSIHCFN